MEELIKQLMKEMGDRLDGMDRQFAAMRDEMGKRFDDVDKRFNDVDRRFDVVDQRFDEMNQELTGVKDEQHEMRVEMAFFYASLQRQLEDTRSEMRSGFKHTDEVLIQHRGAMESLGDRRRA